MRKRDAVGPTFDTKKFRLSEVGKAISVAALALLASAILLLFSTLREFRASNAGVQKANAALLQIAEINTLVIGVDTTARGYGLTDAPMFVTYEKDNQARLAIAQRELARLVSSDPDQVAAVGKLETLTEIDVQIFANAMKLGPGHAREIAKLITDPAVRQKRYDVQNALTRLHDTQINLLLRHQSNAERQLRHTLLLSLVIVAVAFLAGILDTVVRFLRGWRIYERI